MNEIMTIGGVNCYEENGVAYLNLENVARGLGFTEKSASGNECVRWRTVKKYLSDLGIAGSCDDKLPDYIPENIFYRLAMKAKNETAEKFQALVADEIIPSIRKTGMYFKGSKELQAIFMLDERTVRHEERIKALEEGMVVDYGQQRILADQVNTVVVAALGGKDTSAYHDKGVRSKTYSECNRDIQRWFRVNSRNNIPRKRFDEAVEYIQRWRPSTNLSMTIQQTNEQNIMTAFG